MNNIPFTIGLSGVMSILETKKKKNFYIVIKEREGWFSDRLGRQKIINIIILHPPIPSEIILKKIKQKNLILLKKSDGWFSERVRILKMINIIIVHSPLPFTIGFSGVMSILKTKKKKKLLYCYKRA